METEEIFAGIFWEEFPALPKKQLDNKPPPPCCLSADILL